MIPGGNWFPYRGAVNEVDPLMFTHGLHMLACHNRYPLFAPIADYLSDESLRSLTL